MNHRTATTVIAGGVALALMFCALSQSHNTFTIRAAFPWDLSSGGELWLWLSLTLVLMPGLVMVGVGVSHFVSAGLERRWVRLRQSPGESLKLLVFLVGAAAFIASMVGRSLVLDDLHITDDEDALDFAGRALALGKLWVDWPLSPDLLPSRFLLADHGQVTSFDWVGGQVLAMFAALTHSGGAVFSLLAAVSPMAVAAMATRERHLGWGALGAALTLLSPMGLLLGLTTHSQLASRGFVAAALWAASSLRRNPKNGTALVLGLVSGAAVTCRPPEAIALLTPLLTLIAIEALRGRLPRATLGLLVAGLIPGAVLLLGHNLLVSGHLLWPPRFMLDKVVGVYQPDHQTDLWYRLGANLSYNFLMVVLFFAGPVGMLLALLGLQRGAFERALGVGVFLQFLLALTHDDLGLHVVGPIHYSELLPVLGWLAVCGAMRVAEAASRWSGARSTLLGIAAGWGVSLVVLVGFQAAHLRDETFAQRTLYRFIEEQQLENAVLLVPPIVQLEAAMPQVRASGTWVFGWRRPDPAFTEPVILVHDVQNAKEAVHAAFPTRVVYRLRLSREGVLSIVTP